MSWNIDQSRPFSQEEKDWLLTRSGGKAQVAINDARFGELSDEEKSKLRGEWEEDEAADAEAAERRKREEEEEFDEEDVAYVSQLKTNTVKAKIREFGVEPEGTTADELKLELLEILDAKRRGTE